MKPRPVKGDFVVDDDGRRWRVIALDVQDEGFFAERSRMIRFVSWDQFERHWRVDEESN